MKPKTFLLLLVSLIALAGFYSYQRANSISGLVMSLKHGEELAPDRLEVVYGVPADFTIHTNQPFEKATRLGVTARLECDDVEITPGQPVNEGGLAVYPFHLKSSAPLAAQNLKAIVNWSGQTLGTKEIKISCAMPPFGGDQESSFLEMVETPGASIYGSHITVWGDGYRMLDPASELFMVTGHAASSVCREASTVLFGLATSSNPDSPYFMLGAGVGCIDVTGLKSEIARQKNAFVEVYGDLWKTLNPERSPAFSGRSPFSEDKAELGQLRLFCDGIEDLDQRPLKDIRELHERLLEPLAQLRAKASAEDGRFEPLTESEMQALQVLLAEPAFSRQLGIRSDLPSFDDAAEVYSMWNQGKRDEFMRAAKQLVARSSALDSVEERLSDLKKNTGLVDTRPTTIKSRAQVDTLIKRITRWAVPEPGTAGSCELSSLAYGEEGCVLLPFFDGQGRELEFALPAAQFESAGDRRLSDVVRGVAAQELAATAKLIHQRFAENLASAAEQVQREVYWAKNKQASGPDGFRAWLQETETRKVQMVDVTDGRHIGEKYQTDSQLGMLVSAWEYDNSTRTSEKMYRRMVQLAEEAEKDPRFNRISEDCMLDSLLRGWKLSFGDDQSEKQFEEWSKEKRGAAWAVIWKQALEKNFDCGLLRTDSTVFQIGRDAKGNYLVRPRFVADIDATRCIRSPKGGIGFESAWSHRQLVRLDAPTSGAGFQKPSDYAAAKFAQIEKRIAEVSKALTEAALKKDAEAASEEDAEAFSNLIEDFAAQAGEDFRLALCAAPEQTVARANNLILKGCNQDPPVSALGPEDEAKIAAIERWTTFKHGPAYKFPKIRDSFGQDLSGGAWPFPDLYREAAWMARQHAEEDPTGAEDIKKLADLWIQQGAKLDPAYMAEAPGDDGPPPPSDAMTKAERLAAAKRLGPVSEAIRIVVLLSEAEQAVEEWDDKPYVEFRVGALMDDVRAVPQGLSDGSKAACSGIETALESAKVDFNALEAGLKRIAEDDESLPFEMRARAAYLTARLTRIRMSSKPQERVVAALESANEMIKRVDEKLPLGPSLAPLGKDLDELINDIRMGDYDAVDRQRYRHEVGEILGRLITPVIAELEDIHSKAPSRRTLEMLTQLIWSSGQYEAAMEGLWEGAIAQAGGTWVQDPEAIKANPKAFEEFMRVGLYIQLCGEAHTELLKACVYSGGEFFGTSIFGRRMNDWVKKPQFLSEVVTALEFPGRQKSGGLQSECGAAYKAVKAGGATPAKIGPYNVVAVHRSFTDVIVFEVSDELGQRSILRMIPLSDGGRGGFRSEIGDNTSKSLADKGLSVPSSMPVEFGSSLRAFDDGEVLVKRQSLAEGQQMSRLGENGGPTLQLTSEQQQLYVKATLDAAVEGRSIGEEAWKEAMELAVSEATLPEDKFPGIVGRMAEIYYSRFALPERLADFGRMRDKLLERASESADYFEVFASTDFFRAAHGQDVGAKGKAFHDSHKAFIETLWKGEDPLAEPALVHDAILSNYFINGDKVTMIDFDSDYIGSAGNSFSTILTQIRPKDGEWNYPDFKKAYGELEAQYEAKVGRKLTSQQRTEIIQHLWTQPYKFLSSDSGQFMRGLENAGGLPAGAERGELSEALRQPENAEKLRALLESPEWVNKNERYMENVEYSLQLLGEQLTPGSPEAKALEDFLRQVREARAAKLRVTFNFTRFLQAA